MNKLISFFISLEFLVTPTLFPLEFNAKLMGGFSEFAFNDLFTPVYCSNFKKVIGIDRFNGD